MIGVGCSSPRGGGVAIPTVSLAASTASTTFGASMTFTATPSVGFTPTSHRFEIIAGNTSQVIIQVGNILNWTVNRLGSVTVTVVAVDATSSAVGSASTTVSEILANTDLLINNESLFNGAATLPDATAITSVSDQSGTSNDCNQATVARQPRYYANEINGLPAIRFGQTTATHLYSTNSPTALMSTTIVFKPVGSGVANLMHIALSYNDGTDPLMIIYFNAGPQTAIYFRNVSGFINYGITLSAAATHVISVAAYSNKLVCFIDGSKVAETTRTATNGGRTAVYVGGAYIGSYQGSIGHCETQSRAISDTEIYEKQRVLASKWGITLNN